MERPRENVAMPVTVAPTSQLGLTFGSVTPENDPQDDVEGECIHGQDR